MVNSSEAPEDYLGFGTPGYLSNQFYSLDRKKLFIRNIIMPESFFIKLEETIIQRNQDGKMVLYEIGKQFGYRFATLNKFPKGNVNKVALFSIYKFFETAAYAKKLSTSIIDLENKIVEILTEDLVITRKTGHGYLITIGGWTGVMCYLFGDYSLEGNAKKVSKSKYFLISASKKVLKERRYEILGCSKYPDYIDFESYMLHNKSNPLKTTKFYSLEELIKEGIIKYKPGSITVFDTRERVIPVEISLLFDLERNFDATIISASIYDSFYALGLSSKNINNKSIDLSRLLTAFGFGIVHTSINKGKMSIIFEGYPWFSNASENTSFAYIKGAIIGWMDGSTGQKCRVTSVSSKMVDNTLVVNIDISLIK